MISAADVSAAARVTLQTHLPAVLARGVNGRAALPDPTSYAEVPTPEAIRRVKRSVLAVTATKTVDAPQRYGDGTYDAVFLLSVAVWHEQAPDLPLLTASADYAACVRAVLMQRRTLGGLATESTWTGESSDLVGVEETALVLGLGITEFEVRVPNVADEDPLPPVGGGPVATTVTVTTQANPLP